MRQEVDLKRMRHEKGKDRQTGILSGDWISAVVMFGASKEGRGPGI